MKRFIPLFIIVAIMISLYFVGFYKAISFETIRNHHIEMTEYVHDHPILAPFLFTGSYMALAALSIPGAMFFSLIGGYLFLQTHM